MTIKQTLWAAALVYAGGGALEGNILVNIAADRLSGFRRWRRCVELRRGWRRRG